MTFNSYIFILAFFPAFVLLYFTLGKINSVVSKMLIIAGGLVFYAYAGLDLTAILAVSILGNLILSLFISKKHHKKIITVLAIIFNTGLLLYFKYFNFLIDAVNGFTHGSIEHRNIILPLGISFFTFQQIMYVVSAGQGTVEVSVLDYLAYILYFPKLVMGPLMEPADFFTRLNDKKRLKADWDNIAGGLKIFSFGLFKKMLLADTFAKAVAWGFGHGVTINGAAPTATSGDLFLVMLFYTFQIYFDFSGYSDMAVGISKILNIDLPMNFNSPYKALSIRDFWKRWHMSLTNFLTKYIYFPLGGSRNGTVRTYVNIMIVFLVSGLWHGANWTFILWGLLHGLLQVIERLFQRWFDRLHSVMQWAYTFLSVNILWLLFRADKVSDWLEMLKTMFRFQDMSVSSDLINCFNLPETAFILDKLKLVRLNTAIRGFSMYFFIASAFFICLVPENNYRKVDKTNVSNMIICAIAFVWGFLCLSSESVFVYFNF